MTDGRITRRPWRLVEVWGDTADQSHLAWSIGIGIVVSLAGFLIANSVLKSNVASAELARAYAMLAGLAGCVAAGVICAFLFAPKREVVEGAGADPFWREEVLSKLAEQYGDLGSVADLPPAVVKEMKELEIYDLFANFKPASGMADAALDHAKRAASGTASVVVPAAAISRGNA